MQSLGEERSRSPPLVRVEEKTEGNYNGKGLSVLRTRSRDGERGQPFQPAHASSLAGQSSERPDRCGRRLHLQGPRVHEVSEVRLRQKSGVGSSLICWDGTKEKRCGILRDSVCFSVSAGAPFGPRFLLRFVPAAAPLRPRFPHSCISFMYSTVIGNKGQTPAWRARETGGHERDPSCRDSGGWHGPRAVGGTI